MIFDVLKALLPSWFQKIAEYPEVMKAYAAALAELEVNIERIKANTFLQTCDEETLSYWEKKLKLYPPEGEPLEQRRRMAISQWSMASRPTIKYLKDELDRLIGAENYEIEVYSYGRVNTSSNVYQCVYIYVKKFDRGLYDIICNVYYRVAPIHIALIITDKISEDLSKKAYVAGVCNNTIITTIG